MALTLGLKRWKPFLPETSQEKFFYLHNHCNLGPRCGLEVPERAQAERAHLCLC